MVKTGLLDLKLVDGESTINLMTFFTGKLFICFLVVSFVALEPRTWAKTDTTCAQINNIPLQIYYIAS